MTSSDIIKYRLLNQQIAETKFKKPQELVAWLGATQSQDYGMAKWAIGLRLSGLKDADIEKAFNDGVILRTHVLRPTWHFITPSDIRWMLALTAPRIIPLLAYQDRMLKLDKKIIKRSNDVLARSLLDRKQLSREELRAVLQKAKISTNDLRFIHLMIHAELDGIICSGPRTVKQFTYALLDERAPQAKSMKQEEALAELAKRYFTSRGPATVQDFAWWSGLSMTDAKTAVDMVSPDFTKEVVDRQTYFFSPTVIPDKKIVQTTHLLPNYDEYIIGYRDRGAVFDERHSTKTPRGGNAIFNNTILINGKIEGVWQRTIKNNSVVVKTNLFIPLSKTKHQAIINAEKRYGQFLSKSLEK